MTDDIINVIDVADDELFYTKIGIGQAGDIVGLLTAGCVCGPLDPADACLSCCARTEIERLREQMEYRDDVISMLRADIARLGALLHPVGEVHHG